MTLDANVAERLTGWLRTQLPDADDVRVEGLDRVNFGHSAEMMVLTIVSREAQEAKMWCCGCVRNRRRCWNPTTYARQFKILRGLAGQRGSCSEGAVARGQRRRPRTAVLRDGAGRR